MEIDLDFDDVFVNTEKLKVQALNKVSGHRVPNAGYMHKGMISDVQEEGYVTPKEYRQAQELVYKNVEYTFENMKFREDAVIYVKRLISKGHKLKIVTARSDKSLNIAMILLERLGLHIPIVGVGYGNEKTKELETANVYIDDDPKHLEPLLGKGKKLFLMSTNENASYLVPDGVIRVDSWEEFYEAVCNMEQ